MNVFRRVCFGVVHQAACLELRRGVPHVHVSGSRPRVCDECAGRSLEPIHFHRVCEHSSSSAAHEEHDERPASSGSTVTSDTFAALEIVSANDSASHALDQTAHGASDGNDSHNAGSSGDFHSAVAQQWRDLHQDMDGAAVGGEHLHAGTGALASWDRVVDLETGFTTGAGALASNSDSETHEEISG